LLVVKFVFPGAVCKRRL